jgi:hypothetical protein
MDEVPEQPAQLAALRARAMGDPLLRRNLVAEDGHAAGISVRFREMSDGEFIASGLDERIGALLDAATRPGVRFHVAGRPHAKASVYRGMVRDLTVLVPLAVLAIAVVLALATGTRRGVVLPPQRADRRALTFAAMAVRPPAHDPVLDAGPERSRPAAPDPHAGGLRGGARGPAMRARSRPALAHESPPMGRGGDHEIGFGALPSDVPPSSSLAPSRRSGRAA